MACSTSLCLSASIAAPASCSSSSRFLSVPSLVRTQADHLGYGVLQSGEFTIWTIQEKQSGLALYRRSHVLRFLAFASADISQAPQNKRSSGDSVVMVDPLEAKRLAARQMQEIRARETLKKRRQSEAINGALAMIGLTAGLIVEGQTGKGILGQLAGYLTAISSLFGQ